MKGTFFSADFVTDKDEELRLIEINTDTGIVKSQAYMLDWTDFIAILSGSSITEIDIIYKYDIQHPIVKSLTDALALEAPFITSINEIVIPAESIFPTSPSDSASKFILRMAYDESAILDSEYAKGTLNLLKLFADAGDSGSITNFYHSSSYYGSYNTLDTNIFNGSKLPDIITKPVLETHGAHKFFKIGHSDSGSLERYEDFIELVSTNDDILQQYHIPQSQIDRGIVSSVRSFQIVYGPNLDLCFVSHYEIDSVFELPTGSFTFDDSIVNNAIDTKHYYEFATNTIKNRNHGLLENEEIVNISGSLIQIKDVVIGDSFKSYYVEGAPNTDDYDELRLWSHSGNTMPSGSYETSSVLVGKFEDVTFANDLTEIVFADSSTTIIGGEARMLVYDDTIDAIRYERVVDLNNTYGVMSIDGNINNVSEINLIVYDEQQPVYTLNMEEVDNFVLSNNNFHTFYITHNLGISGGCFIKGTNVLMGDGTVKNIEDILTGDEVLSFNEQTKNNEIKKVIDLKQPIHKDMVKYSFSNQTDITSTYDHPFYIDGYNLASYDPETTKQVYNLGREVSKIKEGDMVHISNGISRTAIKSIETLPTEDTQTYIITVEDNHNFYANGILVHNK